MHNTWECIAIVLRGISQSDGARPSTSLSRPARTRCACRKREGLWVKNNFEYNSSAVASLGWARRQNNTEIKENVLGPAKAFKLETTYLLLRLHPFSLRHKLCSSAYSVLP